MNARTSYDEARDAEIRRLILVHAAAIRSKVAAGEAPIAMIANGVTDLLCNDQLAQRLVRSAVALAPHGAGVCMLELVEQVISDQAEVEAVKEVEHMERDRQESADDSRIERAVYAQDMALFGWGGMA